MKILFVQLRLESNIAIMTLSGFLKSKGFETDIVIIDGEKDYISKIKNEIKPGMIGFSATTTDVKKLVAINKDLKKELDFFSIFGGPHPTFFPELIEEEPSIDAICIGEGEYAMQELGNALSAGSDPADIRNIYIRGDNGDISKNYLRPLIDDLDSIPYLDKHIYDRYYGISRYLADNIPIRFLASRGCPYDCTYCFNHKFSELYGFPKNMIRRRSVDSLIDEIGRAKREFDIPMVYFVDDTFCISKEWMREFAEKYTSKIGLPYTVNIRPNLITEEMAGLLARSKCYYVTFSIESGDTHLRNNVLKRNISDDNIINSARLMHKYDIPFSTGNILGVPGEDFDTLRKTLRLNRKCAPHYAWASLFQPFPRLALTDYAVKNGYFDGNMDRIGEDQFRDSPLNLKNKKKIVRFHKFFALLVKYPFLAPVVMLLLHLPYDRQYFWLFSRYKVRLSRPLLTASRQVIERQWHESFFTVLYHYFIDIGRGIFAVLRIQA